MIPGRLFLARRNLFLHFAPKVIMDNQTGLDYTGRRKRWGGLDVRKRLITELIDHHDEHIWESY